MIPVYAVVSWYTPSVFLAHDFAFSSENSETGILTLTLLGCRLGYRFFRAATYYEFGRDAYESIVICSFLILMCNFLGTEIHSTFKNKTRGGLIFPLCCITVNPSNWVATT